MPTSFVDQFGRTITQAEDGSWSTPDGGIHLGPKPQAEAVMIFDAMAPEDYVPPQDPPTA